MGAACSLESHYEEEDDELQPASAHHDGHPHGHSSRSASQFVRAAAGARALSPRAGGGAVAGGKSYQADTSLPADVVLQRMWTSVVVSELVKHHTASIYEETATVLQVVQGMIKSGANYAVIRRTSARDLQQAQNGAATANGAAPSAPAAPGAVPSSASGGSSASSAAPGRTFRLGRRKAEVDSYIGLFDWRDLNALLVSVCKSNRLHGNAAAAPAAATGKQQHQTQQLQPTTEQREAAAVAAAAAAAAASSRTELSGREDDTGEDVTDLEQEHELPLPLQSADDPPAAAARAASPVQLLQPNRGVPAMLAATSPHSATRRPIQLTAAVSGPSSPTVPTMAASLVSSINAQRAAHTGSTAAGCSLSSGSASGGCESAAARPGNLGLDGDVDSGSGPGNALAGPSSSLSSASAGAAASSASSSLSSYLHFLDMKRAPIRLVSNLSGRNPMQIVNTACPLLGGAQLLVGRIGAAQQTAVTHASGRKGRGTGDGGGSSGVPAGAAGASGNRPELYRLTVLDKDGWCVGCMTQLSLCSFLKERLDSLGALADQSLLEAGLGRNRRAMTVSWKSPVLTAMLLMHDRRLSALAIVNDANGRLVGTISCSDVKHLFSAPDLLLTLQRPVSVFVSMLRQSASFWHVNIASNPPATATSPSVTVTTKTSLRATVDVLLTNKVRRAWIVNEQQQPIGMVSIADVVKHCLPHAPPQAAHH